MHNGDRPAGSTGPDLLAEDPVFAGCDRRVVEATGVDRDLIPAMERGKSEFWSVSWNRGGVSPETWTECVAKSGVAVSGEGGERKREGQDEEREFFHVGAWETKVNGDGPHHDSFARTAEMNAKIAPGNEA